MARLKGRGAMRVSRREHGRASGGMGWIVAAVVFALLIVALIAWLYMRQRDAATETTGCLRNGVAPEAAMFMVDATDRLTRSDAQRIVTLIKADTAHMPRFSRISVVPFGDDTAAPFAAKQLDCWPGSGKDAKFDENARMLEQTRMRWDDQVDALVDFLTQLSPSKTSPITKQIVRAASEPTLNWQGQKRLLVLFSDGLESSIYWTRKLKLSAPPSDLLKDVDAEYVEVGNANSGALQSEQTRKQWNGWFEAAGAKVRMTAPGYATGLDTTSPNGPGS